MKCLNRHIIIKSMVSLHRASSFCFVYSQPNTAHGYIIVLEEVNAFNVFLNLGLDNERPAVVL